MIVDLIVGLAGFICDGDRGRSGTGGTGGVGGSEIEVFSQLGCAAGETDRQLSAHLVSLEVSVGRTAVVAGLAVGMIWTHRFQTQQTSCLFASSTIQKLALLTSCATAAGAGETERVNTAAGVGLAAAGCDGVGLFAFDAGGSVGAGEAVGAAGQAGGSSGREVVAGSAVATGEEVGTAVAVGETSSADACKEEVPLLACLHCRQSAGRYTCCTGLAGALIGEVKPIIAGETASGCRADCAAERTLTAGVVRCQVVLRHALQTCGSIVAVQAVSGAGQTDSVIRVLVAGETLGSNQHSQDQQADQLRPELH